MTYKKDPDNFMPDCNIEHKVFLSCSKDKIKFKTADIIREFNIDSDLANSYDEYVSESDMFRLCMEGTNEKAKQFKNNVAYDILPYIKNRFSVVDVTKKEFTGFNDNGVISIERAEKFMKYGIWLF